MKFKKLVSCAIVTAMVASAMAGCGSTTNIENTEVAEATESVETEAETETETEEESKVEVESTTSSNAEEKSEVKKEETNKSSNNSSTANVEETPAHTHAWDGGTVTQAATCTSNGVNTYTCSCRQTKTEAINATGHNWVAQTTTVHHDAEGEYQQVKTGTTKVIICHTCKGRFYTDESWRAHSDEADHLRYTVTTEDTYETQWVETQAAYDETITTGYVCSVCGATQ
jgi:Ni/Co efflux regulator RcnB